MHTCAAAQHRTLSRAQNKPVNRDRALLRDARDIEATAIITPFEYGMFPCDSAIVTEVAVYTGKSGASWQTL